MVSAASWEEASPRAQSCGQGLTSSYPVCSEALDTSHSTNSLRSAPQKLRVRARGSGAQDTHLPDAGLLPIHHRHAAHFVGLDELPLRLVELLRHKAHEGVVWGVSCWTPRGEDMRMDKMFSETSSGLRMWPCCSMRTKRSPVPEPCWSFKEKRHEFHASSS